MNNDRKFWLVQTHQILKTHVVARLFQALKIQDLQQKVLMLHREIAAMAAFLGKNPEELKDVTAINEAPLFPHHKESRQYLGDTAMLGMALITEHPWFQIKLVWLCPGPSP